MTHFYMQTYTELAQKPHRHVKSSNELTNTSELLGYGGTIKGKVRESNQDAFIVNNEQKYWLVIDGMGGHAGGSIASRLIHDIFPKLFDASTPENSLLRMHEIILTHAEQDFEYSGMGATVILAVQTPSSEKDTLLELKVFWIGDCRAYCLDKTDIKQISKDHSFVQHLIDLSVLDESAARHHPKRHIVTQCIGGKRYSHPKIDSVKLSLDPQQSLLLCSDGIHDQVDDAHIRSTLLASDDIEKSVNALLQLSDQQGGNDNATAIWIKPSNDCPNKVIKNVDLFAKFVRWLKQKFVD